jgi:hypothetical protein
VHRYSEVEIKKMLEFLIDNIFVVVGDKVDQQSVGIPMSAYFTTLDLFLYSYEVEFNQKLLLRKKSLAVAFNSTFRYIEKLYLSTIMK